MGLSVAETLCRVMESSSKFARGFAFLSFFLVAVGWTFIGSAYGVFFLGGFHHGTALCGDVCCGVALLYKKHIQSTLVLLLFWRGNANV